MCIQPLELLRVWLQILIWRDIETELSLQAAHLHTHTRICTQQLQLAVGKKCDTHTHTGKVQLVYGGSEIRFTSDDAIQQQQSNNSVAKLAREIKQWP